MDYEKLYQRVPKPTQQWNVDHVCEWLEFIYLAHYIPVFREKVVDGTNIRLIDERVLGEIFFISSKIQQKKILNWIHRGLADFDQYCRKMNFSDQLNEEKNNFAEPVFTKAITANMRKKENAQTSSIDFLKKGAMIVEPYEGGSNLGMHVVYNQVLTIGYGKNNNIQSLQVSIGDRHALIGHQHSSYFLQDLGSAHGTYTKVLGRSLLYKGTIIELGSYQFEVVDLNKTKKTLKLKCLENTSEHRVSKSIRINFNERNKFTFGRKKSNDFSVDDKHLSGIHCWIVFVNGEFMIEDFSSTNGTWIRLSSANKKSERMPIYNGSIVKIGTTITYVCRIHEEKEPSVDTYMEDEGHKCVQCLQLDKNCLMMPCQHNLFCAKCSEQVQVCPQCHTLVTEKIILYN